MPEPFVDNPITRRLDVMQEKWMEFEAVPDLRIGRWLLENNEVDMISGLLAVENTEAAKLSSFLLRYETSFTGPDAYPGALISDFWNFLHSEEAQKDLEEANIDISQVRLPEEKGTDSWLRLMASFAEVFPDPEAKIIAYLAPSEKKDISAWKTWLSELIQRPFPKRVRIMLMDTVEMPEYDDLQNDFPDRFHTIKPNLDMEGAMQEILDEASKDYPDDPGFAYQKKMVAMANEVTKKRMAEAESLAKEALQITEARQWPHLAVSVFMVLGNGYLRVNDVDRSIANFEKAREKARITAETDPQAGKHMEVQTIFGLAGCHMGKNDYKGAAAVYLEGCPVAGEIPSNNMSLECYRMAAYCFEFEKDYQPAWENYQKALEVGKEMTDEEKKSSTLAYVGDGLLRMAPKVGEGRQQKDIEADMAALLGENWKDNLVKTP